MGTAAGDEHVDYAKLAQAMADDEELMMAEEMEQSDDLDGSAEVEVDGGHEEDEFGGGGIGSGDDDDDEDDGNRSSDLADTIDETLGDDSGPSKGLRKGALAPIDDYIAMLESDEELELRREGVEHVQREAAELQS